MARRLLIGMMVAAAGLPFSTTVWAQDDARTVLACGDLTDAQARLACFDRMLPALRRHFGPDTAVGTGAAVSPPAAAAVAPPVAPAAPPPKESFGGPQFNRPAPEAPPREDVDFIDAVVTAHRVNPRGLTILTLDNGQVWIQTETPTLLIKGEGRRIRIEKAALGGYRLTGEGLGRAYWVKRAQ